MTSEQLTAINPLTWIAWIISLPIRATTWVITTVRSRMYDPEKDVCPCCGFRGDRGTGGKTCTVRFTRTSGPEKAAVEHSCLRCGAPYYTKLFIEAKGWLASETITEASKIQQAAKRTTL